MLVQMKRHSGFVSAPFITARTNAKRCVQPAMCHGRGTPAKYSLSKTVMPADTDYSGAMWHGTYVRYLEEARVGFLSWAGVDYGDLVRKSRIELVVSQISVRYREPARLGDRIEVSVSVDQENKRGVRVPLQSTLTRVPDGAVLAEADVILAPINTDTGKLLRRLPPEVRDSLSASAGREANAGAIGNVVDKFSYENGIAVEQ